MKKFLLPGIFCCVLFSCAKEEANSGINGKQNVTSFDEMKIQPTFDWATSHKITLNI